MSKLSNQWIDVFAAGDHGETKGGLFTEADLDDIVRNFDPSKHEPPAVVGHPKDDAPAYAWVSDVRRVGDRLQAKFKDVVDGFEQAVKDRRFPKRSVSLYKTGTGWMLRHVGFLGAQPPQVKGLAEIKFEAEDTKAVVIDFEENPMAQEVNEQSIVDKIVARFAEAFGGKKVETTAGPTFTEAQAKEIAVAAVNEAVKPLQAKLDGFDAKFAESHKAATTSDIKSRVANAIAKLKGEGKWVPAFDKLGVPVLFEELAKETTTVEFGEGAEKKQVTPLEIFVHFMEQHKKIVPTSEVYTGKEQAARTANFAEMPANADPNSFELDALVKARMKDKKETYTVAFAEVCKEHPELTTPGGASSGAV